LAAGVKIIKVMSVQKMYYYLFYKFYKLAEESIPRWWSDWKAVAMIIICETWFLGACHNYYQVLVDRHFVLSNKILVIVGIVLILGNYFVFLHRDAWKDHVGNFDTLPKGKNRLGSLIVLGVILFEIVFVVYSYHLYYQINWKQYR